jgi:desulfoferrodoxin (superoxide reductase-like protein)
LVVAPVLADVPSVLEATMLEEDGALVLSLEVRHNSPSSMHYVDTVEVVIDGGTAKTYDLAPQSSTTFSENIALEVSEASEVEVRVNCNLHGWSSVVNVGVDDNETEETVGGSGIPGFPYGSVLLGGAISVGYLLYARGRRSAASSPSLPWGC